jgi:hypothetical protein
MKLRMFVILIGLVMVWGAASTVGAAEQTADSSASVATGAKTPSAVFPQVKYEFDSVVEGTQVSHGFTVKNTGSGSLDIARVMTG